MKKKLNPTRLVLNRETLRNLSTRGLQEVAGGRTTLCGGTSSGDPCTGTLISDCHCPPTFATECDC
jgi:hypothetical protein